VNAYTIRDDCRLFAGDGFRIFGYPNSDRYDYWYFFQNCMSRDQAQWLMPVIPVICERQMEGLLSEVSPCKMLARPNLKQ
jgi:hypothetical protein